MNLVEVLQNLAAQQKHDESFLHRMGWVKLEGETCDVPGFTVKCNSVWIQPGTGKKFPQVAKLGLLKFTRAIDVAEDDYLRELGWKEIRVRIHRKGDAAEESWYIHPKTKRLFNRQEAVKMARDCWDDEVIMCLLTNKLNELVHGHRLKEGDLLCFDCIDGVYTLWR